MLVCEMRGWSGAVRRAKWALSAAQAEALRKQLRIAAVLPLDPSAEAGRGIKAALPASGTHRINRT